MTTARVDEPLSVVSSVTIGFRGSNYNRSDHEHQLLVEDPDDSPQSHSRTAPLRDAPGATVLTEVTHRQRRSEQDIAVGQRRASTFFPKPRTDVVRPATRELPPTAAEMLRAHADQAANADADSRRAPGLTQREMQRHHAASAQALSTEVATAAKNVEANLAAALQPDTGNESASELFALLRESMQSRSQVSQVPQAPQSQRALSSRQDIRQRRFDSRVALSSRQGQPRERVAVPSRTEDQMAPSRQAHGFLLERPDDQPQGLRPVATAHTPFPQIGSAASRATGALSSSRFADSRQSRRTTSPARASALPLATRRNLDALELPHRHLTEEFARFAPQAQRDAENFASIGRWAALTLEHASATVRHTASVAAAQRLEPHGVAMQMPLTERRRPGEDGAGHVHDGLSTDDERLGGPPVLPVSSGPNRHMADVALLIVDQAMGRSEPFRDIWPLLRDELCAAMYLNYRRTASSSIPLTQSDVAELDAANEARSDDAQLDSSVAQQIHDATAAFEDYRVLLREHTSLLSEMEAQRNMSERLARITQMAFDRSARRAVATSFGAWRSLARQSVQRRGAVVRRAQTCRNARTLTVAFHRWRKDTHLTKLHRLEKRLEEQRHRFISSTKEHNAAVAAMNNRYDADIKSLEFELFQETETRKNLMQVHALEQDEWIQDKARLALEVETLKRVVRQWQRAAQLSNPVDDSAGPPEFLLHDAGVLKATEDRLMAFFVNTSTVSASSPQMMMTFVPEGAGVPKSEKANSAASRVDPTLTEYLNGGWRDALAQPPQQQYKDLVSQARKDLETFLCTWVNHELASSKRTKSQSLQQDGLMQISNTGRDLADGSVYLALCRALTPPEHQRRGDLDVFLSVSSVLALYTAHGLVPPLLVMCPQFKQFFTAETFARAHTHPTAGLWILASLFVSAKCLRTAASSRFKSHSKLAPAVRFSPGVVGMPRPPVSVLVCAFGEDPQAETQSSAAAARPAVNATSPQKGQRRARKPEGHLTLRSLVESSRSQGWKVSSRRSSAASSVSSFDSEFDDDDEWLAHEDDENFHISVPDELRRLGPSELISHWMQLREHSEQWTGLARVVMSLVLRFGVLNDPTPVPPRRRGPTVSPAR